MPSRWTLTLAAEHAHAARPITPVQLHAATAALAEAPFGDHHAQTKPYSVTPLLGLGQDRAELRIGWLTDTHRLDLTHTVGTRVRFGAQFFRVLDTRETRVPYQALRHLPPVRRALLTFQTPTYFARAGRWYPLPDPTLLYEGLVRRWNTYAPADSRIEEPDQKRLLNIVALTDVDITSEKIHLGANGATRVGFRGQAEFTLTGTQTHAAQRCFTALSAYAELAGVGAQTTHGLGTVETQLEP